MNWLTLDSITTLDKVIEDSYNPKFSAIAIFKHSTRCPVSFAAKARLEMGWKFNDELPAYYLDLIEYRTVSNQIEERFNVRHESPQILVIKNGKCIHSASHISISAKEVEKILQ